MVTEVAVLVTGYAQQPSGAVVRLDPLDRKRRVSRAVGSFGMFFGLAIVSVFIPVAHFLLVPGFLIVAVASLVVKLGTQTLILGAHGTCPDCGVEQDFDLPGVWRLPQDIACKGCHRRLTFSALPST